MKTVEQVRKDLPILARIAYFDSASVCPPPIPVIQSMVDYYKECPFNYKVSKFKLALEAARRADEARENISKFINAESSSQIVFTKNATEALNIVVRGLKWNSNDEVIITSLEHQSNIIPWQGLAKEIGVKIRVVKANEEGMVEPEEVQENISKRTKLVAITHVSNVFGTIQKVAEIGKITRDCKGVLYLVDAAQSAGRIPIDVRKMRCDLAVFCGRKALLGPQGTGFLYGTAEVLNSMEPLELGSRAANIVNETEFSVSELPFKFEAGVLNTSGLIGLGRAVKYIEEIGVMNILKRTRRLTGLIIDSLAQIPGIELYCGKTLEEQAGIVPFNVRGYSPHDVAITLDTSDNVAVASGTQGSCFTMNQLGVEGIVRASVHYFNSEDEVWRLLNSLKKLKSHR